MNGTIDGELATVISSVSLACKQIASLVNRAGISNLTGVAGNQNVQVGGWCWSSSRRPGPWQLGELGLLRPGSWPNRYLLQLVPAFPPHQPTLQHTS